MHRDFEHRYLAVQSRDPRFDGWFFTAVTSTRIYCRPSCPARTPLPHHVRFYPSAAAAQQAGFRACKRCRPDAAPGSPEWDTRADLVARAMRLIADGILDRSGVPGLASALGYSTRQLQRLLLSEVGAGPLAIARAHRSQTARLLIETTDLPMAEVAFGAGFSSVRQFNDTVQEVFALSPTELRRAAGRARTGASGGATTLTLRLPFRLPLHPGNLFGHLAATAVPGVEEVRGGSYRRTLRLPNGTGIVELAPSDDHVVCRASLSDLRDLNTTISRCRRLLDLDADPTAVDDRLSSDPVLRPLVERAPGRRVPRCVEASEMVVRAVVGQQISTDAARSITARMVRRFGGTVSDAGGGLTHLFPAAHEFDDLDGLLPAGRQRTLSGVVDALRSGRLDVGVGCDGERAVSVLSGLAGIGPWTVQTVAMRALGDPDAFPATDLGVRRAAAALGLPPTPRALGVRADAWRPWRAYAVQHLWSTADHPINAWPPAGRHSRTPEGAP